MELIKKILNRYEDNKILIFEIVAILVIILFGVSLTPKTFQNDTYYTITIGRDILKNGIDMVDHYSWHENLPYTYPHWLYDVCTYLIYNMWDFTGVYVLTCILSAILGVVIYKVNKNLNKNQIISFLITMASMYLLKSYIAARAQLVTFILFVLIIYLIEKFLEKKKIRYAIGIILISLLISNLHVAVWPFMFVLFLPYIAEYIICVISDCIIYETFKKAYLKHKKQKLKDEEKQKEYQLKLEELNIKNEKIRKIREEEEKYKIKMHRNDNVKWLFVIIIICALTGLLTPLGDVPYTYLYKTMQGNTTENINEHLPLTLINDVGIMCAIIVFLAVMIFTKSKIRLSDLFMIGGLTYLMFLSKRQSTMFVLIGGIILNRLIIQLFELYDICKIKEIGKKYINLFTTMVLAIIFTIISLNFIDNKKNNSYVNKDTYPVEASEWILKNLDVQNIKLYNEYNYGSYLLFKGIPVFIDSRADLYAPEFNTKTGDSSDGQDIFSDFLDCSNIGTYYGDVFEDYGITHVLVYKNSKVNMLIEKADSEKYELLYSDKFFVIYKVL